MSNENQAPEKEGVSRRGFIKAGIIGGAVLVVGYGATRQLGSYAAAPKKFKELTDKEYAIIQAMADIYFPKGAGGTPKSGSEAAVAEYVDNHLANLRPGNKKLTRALFMAFEHTTIVFGLTFKKFTQLSPEKQEKFLRGWEQSSIYLRRQLAMSAKAMLAAAYFADPQVRQHFRFISVCE
jgi:Gluconate 2-dehydrogenase subunit 3